MAIGNEIFQHAGDPARYMVTADNAQGMAPPDVEQDAFNAGPVWCRFSAFDQRIECARNPVALLHGKLRGRGQNIPILTCCRSAVAQYENIVIPLGLQIFINNGTAVTVDFQAAFLHAYIAAHASGPDYDSGLDLRAVR